MDTQSKSEGAPPTVLPADDLTRALPVEATAQAARALGILGEVWAPVEVEPGFHQFKPVEPDDIIEIFGIQTLLSAKAAALPPHELLVEFTPSGSEAADGALFPPVEAIPHVDTTPRVLFGIHPCDLSGMKALDEVMRDGETDTHYFSRRNELTLVGVECLLPCWENAFCSSIGTYRADHYDLLLRPAGSAYILKSATEKGELAARALGALLREPTREEIEALRRLDDDIEEGFSERRINLATLPRDLGAAHASPIWDTMAQRCLDCGQCVFVCPTCYCFDVEDRVDISLGCSERCRKWDGCMLRPFAEVAGGENFRAQRAARIRHRMYRKGRYLDLRHGMPFCVGCGRCVATCPVDISVIKTFEAAQGRAVDV